MQSFLFTSPLCVNTEGGTSWYQWILGIRWFQVRHSRSGRSASHGAAAVQDLHHSGVPSRCRHSRFGYVWKMPLVSACPYSRIACLCLSVFTYRSQPMKCSTSPGNANSFPTAWGSLSLRWVAVECHRFQMCPAFLVKKTLLLKVDWIALLAFFSDIFFLRGLLFPLFFFSSLCVFSACLHLCTNMQQIADEMVGAMEHWRFFVNTGTLHLFHFGVCAFAAFLLMCLRCY